MPLTVGSAVSGTLATPAEQDRFTFNGTVGQRLYLDALNLTNRGLVLRLSSPSGNLVWEQGQTANFGPFHLLENGTYTVAVRNNADTGGDYGFRLLDLASATPISLGATVSGQISPNSQTEPYAFSGVAGQKLDIQNISSSSNEAVWNLVRTDNQTMVSASISNPLGEVVLPVTGNYLILVEGSGQDAAPLSYSFKAALVSSPTGNLSGFGALHAGDLAPGETEAFTYTAPSGTMAFLDLLTNASGSWELRNPADELVAVSGVTYFNDAAFVLPQSGTYTFSVKNPDTTASMPYAFRLLDLAADSTALAFGTAFSGTVNPYETKIFRFSGTAGQRLILDLLQIGAIYYSWSAAAGQVFLATAGDSRPFTLTESGTYYLAVTTQNEPTPYSFRLIDEETSPALPLALNTPISRGATPLFRSDVFRFDGALGQRLFFDFASTNGPGSWTFYGPDGNPVPLASNLGLASDSYTVTLPGPGQYLLVASSDSADTGGYSFIVTTPNVQTLPLQIGAATSGQLTRQGEEHRFTFEGLGKTFYYDAMEADFDDISVRLFDAAGTLVTQGNAASDFGPVTLNYPGMYTLVIGGQSSVTNDYSFRLIDVSQNPASPLALDATFTGFTDSAKAKILRFDGQQGQRLFFSGLTTNQSQARWDLFGPNDARIDGTLTASDFTQTLPATARYLLVVSAASTETNSYSVRIVTPETIVAPLALGAVINGSLGEPGEERAYTFSGSAGQRLFYDALDSDFDEIPVRLFDPAGEPTALFAGNSDADLGPFTLPRTGVYRLVIGGLTRTMADYSFRLSDISTAPVASGAVSGQLNPRAKTDLYRLNITRAGDTLTVATLPASSTSGAWTLYGPHNESVIGGQISSDSVSAPLLKSGTYVLAFTTTDQDPAALSYQFNVQVTAAGTPPSGFGAVNSGTLAPGAEQIFNLYGTAGLKVYFDSQLPTSPLSAKLTHTPSGTDVFNIGASSDSGPYTLPVSGDYVLKVYGNDPSTAGDFRFKLLNLDAVPALTPGTVATEALDEPYKTAVYRLEAATDQHFAYDALGDGSSSTILYLINPNNGYIFTCFFGGCYGNNQDLLFSTLVPGTHYLILSSDQETGTPFSFRILEMSSASVAQIGLNTTVKGSLDPARSANFYRFSGSKGQHLFLRGLSETNTVSWTLYGPNFESQHLGSAGIQSSFEPSSIGGASEQVLPTDGTYYLYFAHNSGAQAIDPADYSFRIQTASVTTETLSLGATITRSFAAPGDEFHFVFNGSAGQALFYDALERDFDPVNARLIGPEGFTLGLNGNADSDYGPFTLTESGSYTLILDSNTDSPADFSFRLLNLSAAPAIGKNEILADHLFSGTVETINSVEAYQILGSPADMRLHFRNTNDQITFQIFDAFDRPAGVSFFPDAQVAASAPGNYFLLVEARNATSAVPYSVEMIAGNHQPAFARIGNQTIKEELPLALPVTGLTDREAANDKLTFSLAPGSPSGLTINPTTGSLSWTPTEVQGPGPFPLTVQVSDDGVPALTYSEALTLTVTEVNKPPALNPVPDKTADELTLVTFTATATDPDLPANPLAFSLGANAPVGAVITAAGVFTWTPTEAQGPSTNQVTIIVTDTSLDAANPHLTASQTVNIVVKEINTAPVLAVVPLKTVSEGTLLSFSLTAGDSDLPANPLKFSLGAGAPSGATLTDTGVFSWTPSESQGPGTNTITVTVTDASTDAAKPALTDSKSFTIVVTEANRPPILSAIGAKTVNELSLLTFTAAASDPDLPANRLTFSLGAGAPAGAAISTNGVFTWSPAEAQGPSTNAINVIVTDDSTDPSNPRLTASETVSVVVQEVNSPPQIAPIPNQTAVKGSPLTIPVSASDSDLPANLLSFSLDASPAGATIDAASGVLRFIPGDALAGTTNTITVKVLDNGSPSLSATQSFRVTVSGGVTPAAPKIGSITVDSRGVTIVASATQGKSYALEFSANVEITTWTRQTAVTAAGSSVTLTDTTATGANRRFYRVVEL